MCLYPSPPPHPISVKFDPKLVLMMSMMRVSSGSHAPLIFAISASLAVNEASAVDTCHSKRMKGMDHQQWGGVSVEWGWDGNVGLVGLQD